MALILYALDLINSRDAVAVCLWIAALILTMASGFGMLLQVDDAEATGASSIFYLLRLAVDGMLFCAMVCTHFLILMEMLQFCKWLFFSPPLLQMETKACWGTLQFKWLYPEVPSIAVGMERSLHSVLPPVSASILSFHIVKLLMDYWGLDRVAICAPYLFALILAGGMLTLGCPQSSFGGDTSFAISSYQARLHSMMLLLLPGIMHIVTFRNRILSRYAASDEIYDLVLVCTVPYLLHFGILILSENSPYQMSNILFPRDRSTSRGAFVPMVASLAASIALQQRYIIPLCLYVSYQFNGHDLPSTWVISLYLTMATLSMLIAVWVWGRKSSVTNELLFGEYHEDIVQLSISASGLLLGRAFGIPWNLTPLPILAFLGLSVWVTTRMLRYLSIFLFVVHAAGVVLFSYRFAAFDIKIPLALLSFEVSLIRFGMLGVFGSVLIGLVTGFAVRPSGGVGAAFLKRVDVAGILLIVYSLVAMTMELTLLKRPVPMQESSASDWNVGQDDEYLYDHATAFVTSFLLVGVTLLSQRQKVVSAKAAVCSLSLAIGKAIATLIDANESDGKIRSEAQQERQASRLFVRALVASMLFVMMLAPRAFLKPIHVKSTARYKRSLADGKPVGSAEAGAQRVTLIYAILLLPAALIVAVPYVLTPLVMSLSAHYGGGAYYSMLPPLSEMFGLALTLWGVSCLSMLNHYLPDGGGETWKKASALCLLMGIGVAFSAPTVPEWIYGDETTGVSNPYASISSLGSKLANQGRSRTGGWGILSASLATLLAITGPLELRERRHPSGKKDKLLLFRLMTFSVLFGSGVSWFITIQSMSQENFLVLIVTAVGCMVVSFFGTVTCVLGYFLELENFEEVDQIARVWVGAFTVFAFLTGTPQFVVKKDSTTHPFGTGGWLSTYLLVCCCVTLALACVLRARPTKNQATRGLGNLSCILSWALANVVLYGRFGVAGLDHTFDVTSIVGIPASVFGTLVVAPILLALEGEVSSEKRSRVARVSVTNAKAPANTMGITLRNLSSANRFMPPLAGTVLVFGVAALYAILIRGSFLFGSAAKSHIDVFANLIGKKGSDLASLAEKSISHSQALVISARLAGSGIWTSKNIFGPLLHLGGLAASIPSLYFLLSQMWSGVIVSRAQATFALPLNLIPLILCKGIPSLRAMAVIGLVGGIFQMVTMEQHNRRSHMRI